MVKASVIIPTFNGAHKINNVLDSLLVQTVKFIEVIIIIDGSTDKTGEIVLGYQGKFPHIKVIEQANRGRAGARNRGAHEASTDLLIFYDDDTQLEPQSIQKHIDFHMHYIGLVCGNPMEIACKTKTDIQNYKAAISNGWMAKYPDGITRLDMSNLFFTAANCSMRKETFAQLKGFDERLTDGEDFDLAYRAVQLGLNVYVDKDNIAEHHDPITCRSYVLRLRQYAASHQQLKTLHVNLENKTFSRYKSMKRMVYRIFAPRFWVQMVDSGIFVFLLPKKMRYKLYSVIIQSLAIEFPGRQI